MLCIHNATLKSVRATAVNVKKQYIMYVEKMRRVRLLFLACSSPLHYNQKGSN